MPRLAGYRRLLLGLVVLCTGITLLRAEGSAAGFPTGYDAVDAAPNSHRVIFENALVRVLEVTLPPVGQSEPMHHHRWPSFFLDWDTGGKTNHIRYRGADGRVRDVPSIDVPTHPGRWRVSWLEPEPMHSIETVEKYDDRKYVRIEIKTGRP